MSEKKYEPDQDALRMAFGELHSDLRWRRDVEFRYFNFAIGVFTSSTALAATLMKFGVGGFWLFGACCGLVYLSIIVRQVTQERIEYENGIYKSLGTTSVKLLWKLRLYTPDPVSSTYPINTWKYGQGTGFKITTKLLNLVFAVSVFIVMTIALSGMVDSDSEPTEPAVRSWQSEPAFYGQPAQA